MEGCNYLDAGAPEARSTVFEIPAARDFGRISDVAVMRIWRNVYRTIISETFTACEVATSWQGRGSGHESFYNRDDVHDSGGAQTPCRHR